MARCLMTTSHCLDQFMEMPNHSKGINPIGPSDAAEQQYGSPLAQLVACCLTTPNHCLYQWRPTNWYKWYWHLVVHVLQIIMLGFCMDICISPCLWGHPHLRLTSQNFTYKVTLQLLVHAFQIITPTFLYVYVHACLWVCNSHSHVHIYVFHIFIRMPNHLDGINPMQPSDAT